MSTYRAYNSDGERISTAVIMKDGKILQVYPFVNEKDVRPRFETKEEWLANFPLTASVRTFGPRPVKPLNTVITPFRIHLLGALLLRMAME